ncbi:hypothetical protein LDENG_00005200 [Lucifuga dentata]|nr:hypothetical protein LDENG_00005200 [Lucifuga dentata]
MQPLTLVSWNVHGICSQAKKTNIMNYITKLNVDICLLQETHLSQSEEKLMISPQFSQAFSACYNSRQRGVTILIHRRVPFILNSTVIDPEGRYIIIQATIFNKTFTIVNLYAPNNDDPAFFHTLFSQISSFTANSITIVRGDFNTVLNPSIDHSNTPANVRLYHAAKTINEYMDDFGLVDSWRIKNRLREYMFFSPVHQSFSRIHFFLTSNSIIPKTNIKIHPIILSDHAPVTLTVQTESTFKPSHTWHFNTLLLKDPEFDKIIRKEWADFLERNDSPSISPSLLWETGKAVIRGKIISYSSFKKKQEQKLENDLEEKIKHLTNKYATDTSEQTD